MHDTPPGERPFFKYASQETTLAILKNRNMRYSSPLKFNDPFDVQSGLHFDFDINTLHDKVLDRLEQLASSKEDPDVDSEDVWGKVVLEARRYYRTHGFPKGRWRLMTKETFSWLIEQIKDTQANYQKHWWEKLLPGVRVFCVSEDRDNLLMWAHYARDHTGAVLEFWSLPAEDNPLSVARRIQYVSSPPSFFSEAEWIDDIVGVKKLDINTLYRRYAYAKSDHWKYEREWRVWYPLSASENYDYVPVKGSEFRAIYIGCKADQKFADEVAALAATQEPQVKVYRASKCVDSYTLDYTVV